MPLSRLGINRPLTMLMFVLAALIMGYQGITHMNIDRYPNVDFPFVVVSVAFPGASPEDVEDLIVKPIEDALIGVEGIDTMSAEASESFGLVALQFLDDVDGGEAALDVERRLSNIQLPDDASDPSILKIDPSAIPIMTLLLSGPQTQNELAKIAKDVIKPRLQSVKGVGSINVSGGRDKIVRVTLDSEKMRAYDLTISQITNLFAVNNMSFPVGTIEDGNMEASVRSIGAFQSFSDIENMIVAQGEDYAGRQIYLRDIATVEDTHEDETVLQRFNGQDAVTISFVKISGANVIKVADGVKKRILELNQELPSGAQIEIVFDDSQTTRNYLDAVQKDLILALIITSIVMLVFLHTIRATFIVIIALPVAMISTFFPMWILGFSLNMLTLLALTLIIGILVDDATVTIENTERHMQMNKKTPVAAIDGRAEIALPAIAISSTDIVVYVPVALLAGIVGQFFFSYGMTIVFATTFSVLFGFALTPMLAAYLLDDPTVEKQPRTGIIGLLGKLFTPIDWLWQLFVKAWNSAFDTLANVYATFVGWSLKNVLTQSIIIIIAIAILIGSAYLPYAGMLDSEFMPFEDNGRFVVNIRLPPATKLELTENITRQIEQLVLQHVPETVNIITTVGAGGSNMFIGASSNSNLAELTVKVVNKNDRERGILQIVEEFRPLVQKFPDAEIVVAPIGGMSPPGSAVAFQISGTDTTVLKDLSDQIATIMRSVPNTVGIVNRNAETAPETRLELDRERMKDLGLMPAQVVGLLRSAVSGADVGDYKPEGEDKIEINVRLDDATREDISKLMQLPVGYNRQGVPTLLSQVTNMSSGKSPASISRIDRERTFTVSCDVLGSNIGGITAEIEKRIANQVIFPPGYGYKLAGESEMMQEAFTDLGGAIFLGILLVYMILVALYQSFLQPLAIGMVIPMSVIGVIWGLYLTDNSLNIFSILGILMLVGVVTRNSILLIDFANLLQERDGMERKAALIEAGRLRLRPILMTSATLIFALLPVLFSTADGSESRQPLAAVLAGGASTSGFLSLLLVPIIYHWFENLGEWSSKVFKIITGQSHTW
ncbi:MAG: hypothetical protein B6242_07755 [Anaerolineaceae bacterium 4572_78]|nr:MAG: hypothetical protein B6242_07755 [Anaerolineaceae bacterium 4572_78]